MTPFARDRWGHEYALTDRGEVAKRLAGTPMWRFEGPSRAWFDRYRGLTLDDPIEFLEVSR